MNFVNSGIVNTPSFSPVLGTSRPDNRPVAEPEETPKAGGPKSSDSGSDLHYPPTLADEVRAGAAYLVALGKYSVDEANATRINSDTWMQLNEYLYSCMLEQERRLRMHAATERRRRVEYDRKKADDQRRWRESPNSDDIRRGHALNALFDELTGSLSVREAAMEELSRVPFERDWVSRVPFGYHGGATKTFLPDLWDINGWPGLLQSPALLVERQAYQDSLRAVEGMDIAGKLSPEYLQLLQSAVRNLRCKLAREAEPGERRDEAEVFLRGVAVVVGQLMEGYSCREMARTAFGAFGQGSQAFVSDFLEFVDTYDLFFHPATNNDSVYVYEYIVTNLLGAKATTLPQHPGALGG